MKITFELNEKEFEELKDLIFVREGTDVTRESKEEKKVTKPFFISDDVVFDNRGDAEVALDCIRDCAKLYGFVTVGDYKRIVGIEHIDYVDHKYRWSEEDIKLACVSRTRGGYKLILPYPTLYWD